MTPSPPQSDAALVQGQGEASRVSVGSESANDAEATRPQVAPATTRIPTPRPPQEGDTEDANSDDEEASSSKIIGGQGLTPSGPGAKGTWVREMALNDLLQVLARRKGMQFFYNPRLKSTVVTGNLKEDVPTIEDMASMALQYDVMLDANGSTLMAFSRDQLGALPKKDYVYSLKYLRPNNAFTPVVPLGAGPGDDPSALVSSPALGNDVNGTGANFRSLLAPVLSETGVVTYEPKTNKLIISDNEYSLARAVEMLDQIDTPKKQVIVKVQILRLNNTSSKFTGVDWSNTFGRDGLNVGASISGPLDQIFNTTPIFGTANALATTAVNALAGQGNPTGGGALPATNDGVGGGVVGATPTNTGTSNAGIVLSPLEVGFVLRFLMENDMAQQEAGPAVITEDNEPALFRVVERIPIIEQQIDTGGSGGDPIITIDARYRIDPSDPIDPANAREVGVSVAVTPQILPDNTIRMDLLPRVSTITRYTRVFLGVGNLFNEYPNINETTVDATARIPDGYTLVLGGYYQDELRNRANKIPFFGDVPGLSFAFRSESQEKVRSNIVFLITPTTYDPANVERSVAFGEMMRQSFVEKPNDPIPDPQDWPKENSDTNLGQRIVNMLPWTRKPEVPAGELSADNPENYDAREITTPQQQRQKAMIERMTGR